MNIKIMRGIPGSGKSTHANKLWQAALPLGHRSTIVSADTYFMNNGVYQFDATKLGAAHKKCMQDFLMYTDDSVLMDFIVVDNTNINIEDIAPYVAVGEALGYNVEILQVNCTDPELAASRNIHKVPRTSVLDMYYRLNHVVLPRRWKKTFIPCL